MASISVIASLSTLGSALVFPAPSGRVVALGDLHGDLKVAVRTLQAARLLDSQLRWIGGDATLVQLGDLLDRGAEERSLWDLMERLREEASAAGGQVVQLLGNHEILNALGKAGKYIHPMGHSQFGDDRCAAFRPGGDLAAQLAEFPVAAIVGDSVFVHASLPTDATRPMLEKINEDARRWLLGTGRTYPPPALLGGRDSPVWDRTFSDPSDEEPWCDDCDELRNVLSELGVSRVVVGHTPQSQVNSACDGAVWRCDTGASRWVMCGECQALEIVGDNVRVIREPESKPADLGTITPAGSLLTGEGALDDPVCGEQFIN